MNRAIGMVMASEKVPQGESARALTTTRASTASRMIMMANKAPRGGRPAEGADLVAGHLAEALAVAPHREEQDHHILDGAGEDHPEDDPHRPRQVTHLGGHHGPDQGAGPG